MTGSEGNSELRFPRILMFPETKSSKTLRFNGSKIQNKKARANFEKCAEIPVTTSGHL